MVKKGISILILISIVFCFLIPMFPVKAASVYEVYLENGNTTTLLSSVGTYKEAHTIALSKEKENQNNNLVIYKDGKIQYVTYGLVNFNTKGDATTTYTIEFNNKNVGYTNGAYGADGAFLGTDETGTKVRFKMSGVIGWVNIGEVEIINMNKNYNSTYTSSYIAGNLADTSMNEWMHNIATSLTSSKMSTVVLGQEIPSGVALSTKSKRTYYLSYDGHYFYPESLAGFQAMIRDYKNNVHTNAVNATAPYYNYYQFVSHRSISNYTPSNIRQNLSGYTAKPVYGQTLLAHQSQLFGEETSFIQYQNEFGANAMLMLGVAKNESATGRSSISIRTNNLFGHGAYDSAPGVNADRYVSVAQGIYAHAKYFVSEAYLDPCDGYFVNGNGISSSCHQGRYYGGHVGDKGSGINVRYASDPYWGEKASKNYYYFDKQYGLQDYGKYGIGIKEGTGSYPIKANSSSNSVTLYMTGSSTNYPVTILGKVTGESINGNNVWYKIQTDPTLNGSRTGILQDQGTYNYNHNIGYIHSSYLTYVKLGKVEKNRYTIKFNPNGGKFSDNITSTKSLTVEEYSIPDINPPSKDGYIFAGWDKEVVAATEDVTYTALYRSNESYQITFDANGGAFIDGTNSKKVTTEKGQIPQMNLEPSKSGYVFTGWSPKIVVATGNTTYKAQYSLATTVELKQMDAFFYLDSISNKNGKLQIKGFQTIEGIDNNLNTEIQYMLVFKEIENSNKVFTLHANRITNTKEIPFPSYGIGTKDYSYAWFQLETDFASIEDGNYIVSVVAYTNREKSVSVLNNRLFAPQITNYSGKKEVIIRNNYYNNNQPIEFVVRTEKLANRTTNTYTYNQFDQFFELNFVNDQIHIKGYTYSYGMDLSVSAKVTRKIIFENKKTYKKVLFDMNAIKGDYDPVLPQTDFLSKTLAWYSSELDISGLEKGTYRIYLATTSNISDIAELTDLFNQDVSKIKQTINGKNYQFKVISERGNTLELIVS